MHRHGYKGRKFRRERDQRRALVKGLADSLVLRQEITTTLPKAKEIVPYVEKLITKAKKGDLHNRRLIISKLHTIEASHKLVDEIAPKLGNRSSGHLRITKTGARKGDNTQMAKVSFVDDLNDKRSDKTTPAVKSASKQAAKKPSGVKKAPAAIETNQEIPTSSDVKRAAKPTVSTPNVRKRRGIRGNR
jgi:large subunit ribosomal protein L17